MRGACLLTRWSSMLICVTVRCGCYLRFQCAGLIPHPPWWPLVCAKHGVVQGLSQNIRRFQLHPLSPSSFLQCYLCRSLRGELGDSVRMDWDDAVATTASWLQHRPSIWMYIPCTSNSYLCVSWYPPLYQCLTLILRNLFIDQYNIF